MPTERLYFEDVNGERIAVAFHAAGSPGGRSAVVMAHGFHGDKTGSARHFVDLARDLAQVGVSTLRFDQPGSGDSSGNFEDASFDAWVATIEHFARRLHADGYRLVLLGESMGGVAAMAAAARLAEQVRGLVLWNPDPMLDAADPPQSPPDAWPEEGGQRVSSAYWREAAVFDFLDAYRNLDLPVYMVFGTADHFVPVASARLIESQCKPGDRVRVIDGLPHSAWPVARRDEIFRETREWILAAP
jgi:alpha-beta hydrolase superfamily lysophospholipase